ncbi:MAG: hypothetical protein LBI64_05515 [Coriobacteriales bacterium]|nr:hypothetical protein [Coriobacteriales bacterium]
MPDRENNTTFLADADSATWQGISQRGEVLACLGQTNFINSYDSWGSYLQYLMDQPLELAKQLRIEWSKNSV